MNMKHNIMKEQLQPRSARATSRSTEYQDDYEEDRDDDVHQNAEEKRGYAEDPLQPSTLTNLNKYHKLFAPVLPAFFSPSPPSLSCFL